jgi:predicted nucleotidyltransferase
MRLSKFEIKAILDCFFTYFLPEDRIWLFGSRANPAQKGGDIDLYIETQLQDPAKVIQAKSKFLILLIDKIGEQKIDVVIRYKNQESPIFNEAKRKGIELKK